MTIRMIKPWNGYQPDAILSLGSTEEARLVSIGMATHDLNGDPDPEGQIVRATTNPLTGGIAGLVGLRGSRLPADLYPSRSLNKALRQHGLMAGNVLDLASATFVANNAGSGSLDTSARNAYGGYSATLNIDTVAGSYVRYRSSALTAMPNLDVNGAPFVLVVERVSGFNDNDIINLVFSDNPATKSLSVGFSLRVATYTHGNFYYFVAGPNDFSASGDAAWTDSMTYCHVQANCAGTTGGVLKVHGIFRYLRHRPKLLIEFDDAFVSQYTQAFPVMAQRGLTGTVAVIADRVGTTGYCSEAQLDEMYAAGWGMVVHGDTAHTSFGSQAALEADLIHNRDYVAARWPDGARHYVYPTGAIASFSKAALANTGFTTARTTISGKQASYPWGVDDPLCLWSSPINDNSKATILTTATRAVEAAATQRMHGHRVVQTVSDASNEISISDFATFISGVSDLVRDGKIDCMTVPAWADLTGI